MRIALPRLTRRTLGTGLAVALTAGIAAALAFAIGSGGGAPSSASAAQLPFLGVETQSLPGGAVLVDGVVPGSPAAVAGLGPGDVIVALAGHAVSSPAGLETLLTRMHAGERVRLRIQRGGAYLDVEVRLGRPRPAMP